MGLILYNVILILILPLTLPVFTFLIVWRPAFREGLAERLGHLSGYWGKKIKSQPRIWIHAASVGECQAVLPMAERWLRERPECDLVFSVMTLAGRQLIRQRLEERVRLFYFPADLPGISARVIRRLEPDLIVLVETELWPNFLQSASRRNVPAILINGRISPASYPRYRMIRWILRGTLRRIELFCMQSSEDARRLIRLGAPPERVRVMGNLKFDQTPQPLSDEERRRLLERVGWSPGDKIFAAGSTHEGEERAVLSAYQEIKKRISDLRLILAPRHLDRLPQVTELLNGLGLTFVRYTELGRAPSEKTADVLLVDMIGPLNRLYDLAQIIFVGGSLAPVGGHNLLEPAALGRPVLFGPHIQNIREMADRLLSCGGARLVQDEADLVRQLEALLVQADVRDEMGRQARQTVLRHQGASRKTLEALDRLIQRRAADRIRRLDFRSVAERWFTDRLLPSQGGLWTRLAALILGPLSIGYRIGQEFRVTAYRHGLFRTFRLDRPVISVGNLTLGGTGKTPTVMAIARILLRAGRRPVILSRGYGGALREPVRVVMAPAAGRSDPRAVGDEPCLLAERLPEVPVVVGRDRVVTGRYAVDVLKADEIILDDGYQHLRLARDRSLLILDAGQPFGNGRVFPAGNLRESIRQIRRADAILLTHLREPDETEELQRFIREYHPGVPIFTGRHRLTELIHLPTGRTLPLETIRRNRILAVAGIGRPDSFFRMLHEAGAAIAAGCVFPDHYHYGPTDLERLEQEAGRLEVSKIITTEKDAVRLRALDRPLVLWWSARVELVMDQPESFESMIEKVLV